MRVMCTCGQVKIIMQICFSRQINSSNRQTSHYKLTNLFAVIRLMFIAVDDYNYDLHQILLLAL